MHIAVLMGGYVLRFFSRSTASIFVTKSGAAGCFALAETLIDSGKAIGWLHYHSFPPLSMHPLDDFFLFFAVGRHVIAAVSSFLQYCGS